MSKLQRINSFVTGVLMLVFCLMLLAFPKDGYYMVVHVLAIVMMIGAVKMLWFYFTMAKYMVGGKQLLYQGVIIMDLAIFTLTLSDVPLIYVILYLIAVNAVAGAIDMGLALNAWRTGAPSWKLKFSAGFVELGMAALCIFNIKSTGVVVYIYAAGIAYAGFVKIVSALRKTSEVYIQ